MKQVGGIGGLHRLVNGGQLGQIFFRCAIGDGQSRLSVKFSLVAMLFILFDSAVVFMYPWAGVYRDLLTTDANLIFGAMVSFLGVLFVGYIYALKKGAFDWKR